LAAPARPAWTVSLLVPADTRLDAVGSLAAQFNDASDAHGVAVVAVEYAATNEQEVERFAAAVPPWLERYVEVPLDERLPRLLDAAMRSGCYAKVRAGGVTEDRIPPALVAILEESDPAAFDATADAVSWRDIRLTADDLVAGRAHALRSVGSCSFEEPVEDLRRLGWIEAEARTS
jgi:hypothetical protein